MTGLRTYRVEVAPRFPSEGGRRAVFTVDPRVPEVAASMGTTAREIAAEFASAWCDSGTVTVESHDGIDRARVVRS